MYFFNKKSNQTQKQLTEITTNNSNLKDIVNLNNYVKFL